jgi:AraC-like DNA-binding protein
VVTLLTPAERLRVDAVGMGAFTTAHQEAMDQVVRELRRQICTAVVLSVAQLARGGRGGAARVSDIVRAHPRVAVVGLVAEPDPAALSTVLALGRAGVRTVVDARQPGGWHGLRALIGRDPARQIGCEALARLAPLLAGSGEGTRRFFEALFEVPPEPVTVHVLARRLGVRPTTLMSRFTRAGLPTPKRYVALARLVRVARLLENRSTTLSAAADRLEYSSAQSFGRHVRMMLGVSAAEFRRTYDAERMLARFCGDLVTPYTDRWRGFSPLGRA